MKINHIAVVDGCGDVPNMIRTTGSVAAAAGPARASVVGELSRTHSDNETATILVSCTPATPAMTRDAVVGNCLGTLEELLAATSATIWVSNRDAALRSHDLWHMLDHFGSARVGLWVDIETLIARGETPSVFLKQLAQFTRAVAWRFESLTPLACGERQPAVSRMIEILKGVAFRGLVVIDDAPDETASQSALVRTMVENLRAEWRRPAVVLAAYKGDKHAPRFAAR